MACSTFQRCQHRRCEDSRYTPSQHNTTSNGLASSQRFASQLRETLGRHPPRYAATRPSLIIREERVTHA